MNLNSFEQIFCVDFEFQALPGESPTVICMVAKEIYSGKTVKLWEDDLAKIAEPPIPLGKDTLYVAYYASAEMGCHIALNLPMPHYLLDLFAEFKVLTNGISVPSGYGLLGAMAFYGLNGIEALEKKEMRELAMRGGPWTYEEKEALINYCESDVLSLEKLLKRMSPLISLEQAIIRGRYMQAAAHIEFNGVPLDVEMYDRLKESWLDIQDELI